MGQLTAFPVAFLFFFLFFKIQRLTEPILANFGLKLFQPKRRKADTCSSYEHGHFVMAPWGSTVLTKFHRNQQQQIVGRNKQERKESSSTQSKARSKTSAVKPNNMTLFIIHSHSLSFLNVGEIPVPCFLCKSKLDKSFSSQSQEASEQKESMSPLPWLCQDKNKKPEEKEINQNLHLDYSCRVLSGWMYSMCMLLWVLEELGLLFHVVAFPQGKPVKLLDLHSKDVKERFRC